MIFRDDVEAVRVVPIELFPRNIGDESSESAPSANGSMPIAGTSGNDNANSPPSSVLLHAGMLRI